MTIPRTGPSGIWLPLITPFRDGAVDEPSLRRTIAHYVHRPIDGFILAATTGDGMTLDGRETERLIIAAADAPSGQSRWYKEPPCEGGRRRISVRSTAWASPRPRRRHPDRRC